MPFKSKAQRRWMFANHPDMAKEWQAHTPEGEELPEKVGSKRLRTAGNLLIDVHNQIMQEDLEYKNIRKKLRKRFMKKAFWDGFEKQAGLGQYAGKVWNAMKANPHSAAETAAEIGGLGILMAPSIANLANKPMEKKTVDKLEIGGLGVLMAPYLHKTFKAMKALHG